MKWNLIVSWLLVLIFAVYTEGCGENSGLENHHSDASLVEVSGPENTVDTSGGFEKISKDGGFKIPQVGAGPKIHIQSPSRASMLRSASAEVEVSGDARAYHGTLNQVKVNGQKVKFDQSGNFSIKIKAKWGLNVLRVEANDTKGFKSTHTRTFFWSSRYVSIDKSVLANGLLLRIQKKTIDDNDRKTPNDLATILEGALKEVDLDRGIPTTLDSGSVKIKLPVGSKRVSYTVTKTGKLSIDKKELSLNPKAGGLAFSVKFQKVSLPVKAKAQKYLEKNEKITAAVISASGDLNIAFKDGKVLVTVEQVKANVSGVKAAGFKSSFDFLNAKLTTILQEKLKSALEASLKTSLPDPVRAFIQGFQISKSISLPKLLGGSTVAFKGSLSSVVFDATGGLLVLQTGFSAKKNIPDAKLGTPVIEQDKVVWSGAYALGAGLSYNALNQAMATAWSTGAFKRNFTSVLAGLTAKLPISMDTPTLEIENKLPLLFQKSPKGTPELAIGDMVIVLSGTIPKVSKFTVRVHVSATFNFTLGMSSNNELLLTLQPAPTMVALELGPLPDLGEGIISKIPATIEQIIPEVVKRLSSSVVQKFPVPNVDLSSFGGKYGVPPNTRLLFEKPSVQNKWNVIQVTGSLRTSSAKP